MEFAEKGDLYKVCLFTFYTIATQRVKSQEKVLQWKGIMGICISNALRPWIFALKEYNA